VTAPRLSEPKPPTEKIFGSANAVGPDATKKSYVDVVLLIDAIKAVIRGFGAP
jgi:hypothetical protein